VPLSDQILGGPLALQAHFYEFVPENSENHSPILLAHQLQIGQRYRILYTTSSGIYRYDIGDILEVSGFYQQNPIVHFIRKAGQTCNLVGELMTDYHITQAIQAASQNLEIELPFYIASPDTESFPPRYQIWAEPSADLQPEQVSRLAESLDQELKNLNCDYKSSRGDEQLAPLELKILPPGAQEEFRQRRIAAGADEAQLKPMVLIAEPERLKSMLKLA